MNINLYIVSVISYFILCIALAIFIELIEWVDRTNSNANGIVLLGFGLFFLSPTGFIFASSFYMLFIYS